MVQKPSLLSLATRLQKNRWPEKQFLIRPHKKADKLKVSSRQSKTLRSRTSRVNFTRKIQKSKLKRLRFTMTA